MGHPNEIGLILRLGHGYDWMRVALILQRAVVDGHAEIKKPGGRVRKFRRRTG